MAKAKKSPAAKAPKAKTAVKKTPLVKPRISGTKKKVVAAKKAPLPEWNTIHVFGYGESQAIGHGINGKAPNSELKSIAPLLESLAKKQQKGTKIKMDTLHALNIFNGMFIDFHSKERDNKPQRFAWADVDSKHINKLADELKAKIEAAPKPARRGTKPGKRMQALLAKRKSTVAKAKK